MERAKTRPGQTRPDRTGPDKRHTPETDVNKRWGCRGGGRDKFIFKMAKQCVFKKTSNSHISSNVFLKIAKFLY
jgi:hypothetical protein